MMDDRLLGFWKVRGVDMVEGKTVALLGGLVNEVVEFTANDQKITWGDPRHAVPTSGLCRTFVEDDLPALDKWTRGLEPLVTRCIYRVEGPILLFCIAGNYGPRPTEFRRDDDRL